MKINNIISYILIGILAVFLLQARCALAQANDQIKDIEKTLARPTPEWMPDDYVTYAELDGYIMKEVRRVSPDSVITHTYYIPTESDVEYIVRTDTIAAGRLYQTMADLSALRDSLNALPSWTAADSARLDSLERLYTFLQSQVTTTEVRYDTHGWCMRPYLGFAVNTEPTSNVEVGVRGYYWNQWGIGPHLLAEIPTDSTDTWEASAGLAIDRRLDFLGLNNLAASLSGDYDLTDKKIRGSFSLHGFLN